MTSSICQLFVTYIVFVSAGAGKYDHYGDEVSVFTFVTKNMAGSPEVRTLLHSAEMHGISLELLGSDVDWAGFGQKVNLLRQRLIALMKWYRSRDQREHIVLYIDSDSVFLSGLEDIVKAFKGFKNTKVLFAAEETCWPDESLESEYPAAKVNPYLNAGGFMGYLPELLRLLVPMNDTYDDQQYFTEVYVDPDKRDALKISLDHGAKIFLCMHNTRYNLSANPLEEYPYIEHTVSRERPLILHGNGPCKEKLASLYKYLSRSFYFKDSCLPNERNYSILREDSLPNVTVAAFVEQPTPQLEDFLKQLLRIDYPKSKIHLVLRNAIESYEDEVEAFYQEHADQFGSSERLRPADRVPEADARNTVKDNCVRSENCDYVFMIDNVARVHGGTLRKLLSYGLDVVAPMLLRPGEPWTNFAGCSSIAYSKSGGVWKVPCVTDCYLMRADALFETVSYIKTNVDPDVAFCESLKDLGVDISVSSEFLFGHLVAPITYECNNTKL